jgi:uncharacterized protein (DUF4415 family)/uncharacterized DUF497 family protein
MRIEKSAAKEHSNVRKHGIDFSFAEHIFTDPLAVTVYDRFENSEHRWHTFSWVGGMLLIVVHTFPDPDDGQRRPRRKGHAMSEETLANRPVLTKEQIAQLEGLAKLEPDTDDIPEAPAANWASAQRFYKARKEAISLRIDADVLHWLKQRSDKYQTEINRILREKMENEHA